VFFFFLFGICHLAATFFKGDDMWSRKRKQRMHIFTGFTLVESFWLPKTKVGHGICSPFYFLWDG